MFAFDTGPLGISVFGIAAAAENYFFAMSFLIQFGGGHPIYDRDYFAAAFGALAGFAIYDDRFHRLYNYLSAFFFTYTMTSTCSSGWASGVSLWMRASYISPQPISRNLLMS